MLLTVQANIPRSLGYCSTIQLRLGRQLLISRVTGDVPERAVFIVMCPIHSELAL